MHPQENVNAYIKQLEEENKQLKMERKELKGLLKNYVDLLNRYEKNGNKRAAKKVEQSIEYIKNQLK